MVKWVPQVKKSSRQIDVGSEQNTVYHFISFSTTPISRLG